MFVGPHICNDPHCFNVSFDMEYCHRITCPHDYEKWL